MACISGMIGLLYLDVGLRHSGIVGQAGAFDRVQRGFCERGRREILGIFHRLMYGCPGGWLTHPSFSPIMLMYSLAMSPIR